MISKRTLLVIVGVASIIMVALLVSARGSSVSLVSNVQAEQILGEFDGNIYFVKGGSVIRQSLDKKAYEVLASDALLASLSPAKTKLAYTSTNKDGDSVVASIDLVSNGQRSYKNAINYAWYKNSLVLLEESGDEYGYNIIDSGSGKTLRENATVFGVWSTSNKVYSRTELDPNLNEEDSTSMIINPILPESSVKTSLSGVNSEVSNCGDLFMYRHTDGLIRVASGGGKVFSVKKPLESPHIACADQGGFYVLDFNKEGSKAAVILVDDQGDFQEEKSINLGERTIINSPGQSLVGSINYNNNYLYLATDKGIVRTKP